jgi:hypothetical protein
VTAKLTTSTRAPIAGEPWRYTVTVRRDGQPITAQMRVAVLRGARVVRCGRRGRLVPCEDASRGEWVVLRGSRSASFRWPQAFAGERLTFRVAVTTGHTRIRLQTPVTVRPAG